MNTVELLAPAGSYEALLAAVQNGADAIYLAGNSFGARAYANNFNEEELEKGIAYAHTYGVRIFVTVNTLIKEVEIQSCLAYIERLQQLDVDALIIQDLGLFTLLHQRFPDLELHASTQMHIHNPQGIQVLKQMGAKRVVLPRETPIEQIKEYSKLGIDLEVFIQGALCVSYSGQCLMSAMTQNRSGNRGECAQSCRMKYRLEKSDETGRRIQKAKGEYLLSPKDLNTIDHIPQLIESGITSFKIEGRMKRAEYVALMCASYRQAIDAYNQKQSFKVNQTVQKDMQKIFNRGFTSGHLFHEMGSKLMNFYRPNHMGIRIGKITQIKKDKVSIRLEKEVFQGDGIRILNQQGDTGFTINRMYHEGLLVNHGSIHETIELDKTFYAQVGDEIVQTSDAHQLKALQETYQKNKRKVNIQACFVMHCDAFAILEVRDEEGRSCKVRSTMRVELAKTTPIHQERIEAQLKKSGDTPFTLSHICYDLDENVTLPISELNRLRREALAALAKKRSCLHSTRRIQEIKYGTKKTFSPIASLNVIVHSEEQYKACVEENISAIFIEGSALYQKFSQEPNVYPCGKRVMKQDYPLGVAMIQESGGLYNHQPVLCSPSLNVSNAYSAAFLFDQGAQGVCFSLENSLEECGAIVKSYQAKYQNLGNFIYPIYGREELMISEYCVINAVEKDNDKQACGLCQKAKYALLDQKNTRYPIQCDEDCRMHILNAMPRNRIHEIKEARNKQIHSFLCVFNEENKQECIRILSEIKKELNV